MRARIAALYGVERADEIHTRLLALIERWRGPLWAAFGRERRRKPRFSERDVVLIAYGDHLQREGERPLSTLAKWCRAYVRDCVSTVHVLPFHPSTSYEGYSITDYMGVDPALGSWDDLAELHEDFGLMFDLVLNHCSKSHPWFRQFIDDKEPGRRFFIAPPDPAAPWLRAVHRARTSPLLHPFETAAGTRHVWTTYSDDLIDVNWREPDVCLAFIDILLDCVARGARAVRLDAFGYVWKAEGTSCVNQPACHDLIGLFQDVLTEVGASVVAVLPSLTNVVQEDAFAYLMTETREADLVYHLPLSALLLHTLYAHDAGILREWLRALAPAPKHRAYFNLAACHDGIGLTWCKGLLPDDATAALIAGARARGSLVSSRRQTVDDDERPWEINATYFSACAPDAGEAASAHVARYLATQSVVLALRGVPALYLAQFVAGENDHERVRRTGDNRAINRGRYDVDAWERAAGDMRSRESAVLRGLTGLARVRSACAAFNPEASQRVVDVGSAAVLAFVRGETGPSGRATSASARATAPVLCLASFSASPVSLDERALEDAGFTSERARDLLSGADVPRARFTLEPYGVRWLALDRAEPERERG